MLEKREAPSWVWELIDTLLQKSRNPKAKQAYQALQAALNADKLEWDTHCWKFELLPEHFNKTFMFRGKKYTVVRIKPRSTTAPVIGRNENGTDYKFPSSVLK